MTLLEAIQTRHSVRQYMDKPLDADKLQSIRDAIDLCNREGGTHLQLIVNESLAFSRSNALMYGKFANVSNYIAVVAPKGNHGSELAGYYGERVATYRVGATAFWNSSLLQGHRDYRSSFAR